jgi:triphosphatase
LQRIGRICLDHLVRNEDAALAGNAEGTHQMRVAVRRLRALLSAFAPLLPTEQRRWASRELEWFADALGDVRNLDVFATTLLQPARAQLPPASEFERLALTLAAQRRRAQEAAVAAILSPRYTDAVLGLLHWFEGSGWRAGGNTGELDRPIRDIAPELLERCFYKAGRRARRFARQSAVQRHDLRIALKKLRYAAEAFAGLYHTAEVQPFIQRLKRLQDDLGDLNDVRVGLDIVAAMTEPGRRMTGVGLAGRRVLAWNKRRLAGHEAQIREHLHELVHATPFWWP